MVTRVGTNGRDILRGAGAADLLYGLGGSDDLYGNASIGRSIRELGGDRAFAPSTATAQHSPQSLSPRV